MCPQLIGVGFCLRINRKEISKLNEWERLRRTLMCLIFPFPFHLKFPEKIQTWGLAGENNKFFTRPYVVDFWFDSEDMKWYNNQLRRYLRYSSCLMFMVILSLFLFSNFLINFKVKYEIEKSTWMESMTL